MASVSSERYSFVEHPLVSVHVLFHSTLRIGSLLVFLMQTGFAMLEVGSVSVKNTNHILLKVNVMTVWGVRHFFHIICL